jgi:hypothetical protein
MNQCDNCYQFTVITKSENRQHCTNCNLNIWYSGDGTWNHSSLYIKVDDILYLLEWFPDCNKIRCTRNIRHDHVHIDPSFLVRLPQSTNWNADKLAKYLLLV